MVAVVLHPHLLSLAACEFNGSANIKGHAGTPVATRDLSPGSAQRLLPLALAGLDMRRPCRAQTLAGAVERRKWVTGHRSLHGGRLAARFGTAGRTADRSALKEAVCGRISSASRLETTTPGPRFSDSNGKWLTFKGRPSLPHGFKRDNAGDPPLRYYRQCLARAA